MIAAIKRSLPARYKRAGKMLLYQLKHHRREQAFKKSLATQELVPLPPISMRVRVILKFDVEIFHYGGQRLLQYFEAALKEQGFDFSQFRSILDFGTGCGRLMRWLKPLSAHAKLYGTDIDAPAIRWDRKHLKFAEFEVNQGLPPLAYADEMFDLVLSYSVFSHLDDYYQDQWLAELNRVSKPGAILLITVHGETAWNGFIAKFPGDKAQVNRNYEEKGFFFYTDDGWGGIFPDFYHSMFHKKTYILEHWAKYFEIAGYVDAGVDAYQDIVIARKR